MINDSCADSADMYTQLNLKSCTGLTNIFLRMQYRPTLDGLDTEVPIETQLDQYNNHDAENPQAPAELQPASTTSIPASPVAFTPEEWRASLVILSQLPTCTKFVNLGVELEGTDAVIEEHLSNIPNWAEIDCALAKLSSLERVAIHRMKEHAPFFAQWTKAQHDLLLRQLPTLRERKLLQLHW
jgi:hypothetical protein